MDPCVHHGVGCCPACDDDAALDTAECDCGAVVCDVDVMADAVPCDVDVMSDVMDSSTW